MSKRLSNEDEKYFISLIKEDKIVEAVKFIREKTNMSLLEAKEFVDIKRQDENAEFPEKNNNISTDDKEYIISLINENKKLQAVAFLHKNKNMSLLEAKNYVDELAPYKEKDVTGTNNYYIDNSNKNNKSKFKENKKKRAYIFDKNLNMFVPDLDRQRKINKVIFIILLILVVASLIQLPFLDRTSYTQMRLFFISSVAILPLLVIWTAISLNIYFTAKILKELEDFELRNEFEIKSIRRNFSLFLYILLFIGLVFISYIQIEKLLEKFSFKEIIYSILLIGSIIYNLYIFFKELKERRYSLNIDRKNIRILYKNNEIDFIKTDGIDYVEFYSRTLKKGRKETKPTMLIFNKEEKKIIEMTISVKDYYLLKKYFAKYDVNVADNFIIF